MSNINKRKKVLLVACMITLLSTCRYSKKDKYDLDYEILPQQEDAFASYSNGLIYIGNDDFIDNLHDIKENDILVIDGRDCKNPSFKVLDSYKITSKKEREEIICAICTYDEMYPLNWNRTYETMEFEWSLHNTAYNLNYKRSKTKDVDFDNNDGKFYENSVIKYILE